MLSNVKLPHWAMVLLSLVSLIVAWVIRQDASGAISVPAVVLGVLPIVQTVLGMLSPAVSPTTNAVAAKLAARRAAGVAGMLTLCFVLAGAWACQACGIFSPAVVAPAANLAACVATNAIASKPIAVIATDCESDALAVIAELLGSNDARVQQSVAGLEAKAVKAALAPVDAGAQ